MRALIVVVQAELMQHRFEVSLIHDQHPVQALASAAPDPPFGMCVRPRCHEWGQNHAGSVRAEDAIEAARKLPIVIVNYQCELDPLLLELPAEVASLLRDPGCVWLRRTGRRQDTPEPRWTNISTYSRLKNTVSTLKKSVATRVSAWAARNCFQVSSDLRPAGGIWARRRIDRIVVAETM